eukprot:CAMPEP_0195528290 /NCGR_PEP_ID=MMETSP0794_2-20130614/30369_1 /TAXON_ID=515487 /ORGANISM="Stephanopyxis turris, Strain CCMP 815" /LENGTH=299 /DNA_ID=CAMNT_0040659407 /DNA_START=603 /DNA_END=1502 /DNA_ORIENTATION=-
MRTGIDMNITSSDEEHNVATNGDNKINGDHAFPSKTVFWTGQGQLYSAPSGKVLANIDGFDVCKAVRVSDDIVRQFSRKIFWFRDPNTNEIMTEFNGKPVRPIKYDFQVFDYKRGMAKPLPMPLSPSSAVPQSKSLDWDDEYDPGLVPINPSIVKSMGSRTVPCMPITTRYAGKGTLLYQMPLFIDIQTSKVSYQAWEFYDYTTDVTDCANEDKPPSISWSRQGDTPPFCHNGDGVMHFLGHRVNNFEDLPRHLRELVENEDYEMFKNPPVDMEEVLELEAEFAAKMKARKTHTVLSSK